MSRTEPSDLRTRIRFDDEDAGQMECVQLQPNGHRLYWTSSYSEFSQFDGMTDRLNPIGANGFRLPGPCRHETIFTGGPKFVTNFSQPEWVNGELWNMQYNAPYPWCPLTKENVRSCLSLFDISLQSQEFRLTTWNKWLTQIPEDVSLANFSYELTDFDYLFKNFFTQKKIQKDLSRDWRKDQRTIHPKKMPSMANSTFLSYNFGWAPFIGDLQKLANLTDSVAKRVSFLKTNRGKPVRLYRSKRYELDISNPVIYSATNAGGGNSQHREFDAVSGYAELTASCTLLQNIPGLDEEWNRLRAVLAATGFNNPAKIVWNAIPFSFMVDWIVPMQSLLSRWCTVNPFVGQWDIYDVAFSVKYHVDGEDFWIGTTSNGGNRDTFRESRPITYELYDRKLGMPLDPEEVQLSGLSQHQQRLFASLVAGNTLFRERKRRH